MSKECELCAGAGGELVFQDSLLRVVLVDDPAYPGFCRVVWNDHVCEMSDLSDAHRLAMMNAVLLVESTLRQVMAPDKVNLASLGNMTPHLHWHVIPRYAGDAHFPGSVWSPAQRDPDPVSIAQRRSLLPALRSALKQQFSRVSRFSPSQE